MMQLLHWDILILLIATLAVMTLVGWLFWRDTRPTAEQVENDFEKATTTPYNKVQK